MGQYTHTRTQDLRAIDRGREEERWDREAHRDLGEALAHLRDED